MHRVDEGEAALPVVRLDHVHPRIQRRIEGKFPAVVGRDRCGIGHPFRQSQSRRIGKGVSRPYRHLYSRCGRFPVRFVKKTRDGSGIPHLGGVARMAGIRGAAEEKRQAEGCRECDKRLVVSSHFFFLSASASDTGKRWELKW